MAKARPRPESPVAGRWRIVSRTAWDVEYIEEEGPAFLEFGTDQMGEFRFGLTSGNIDYRVTERDAKPAAEWTWEGMDEMDPCTGRGWAVLDGKELWRHDFGFGVDQRTPEKSNRCTMLTINFPRGRQPPAPFVLRCLPSGVGSDCSQPRKIASPRSPGPAPRTSPQVAWPCADQLAFLLVD